MRPIGWKDFGITNRHYDLSPAAAQSVSHSPVQGAHSKMARNQFPAFSFLPKLTFENLK